MPESARAYRHPDIVVRDQSSQATLNRYKSLVAMYKALFSENPIDPTHPSTCVSRNTSAEPIAAAKELI